MKLTVNPSKGWAMVRREAPSDTTEAGLIKPQSVIERESGMQTSEDSTCLVVAVHPTSEHTVGAKVVVKAQDIVPYFDTFSQPTFVTVQGRRVPIASLYIVPETNIVATVTEEQE